MKTFRAEILFKKYAGDEILVRRDIKFVSAPTMMEGMIKAKEYAEETSKNKRWKLLNFKEVSE